MGLRIEPYRDAALPWVRDFNARLARGGVEFAFPECAISRRWPPATDAPVYEHYYLAVEDDAAVRGGYILKHQTFLVRGQPTAIGNIQLPLSEGTINKAYSTVAVRLVQDALRKQPLTYALGMGGLGNPFPRFLASLGWKLRLLPFHFRIVHARAFFRNIAALRTSAARRAALDVLAATGLGSLGAGALHFRSWLRGGGVRSVECALVPRFGDWADELWQQAKAEHELCAVRDAETLNLLYPERNEKFLRVRVSRGDSTLGWALLLATSMHQHKQFGSMRVGSVIDCLAAPGEESAVLGAASDFLVARNVDVIVTNQAHSRYGAALERVGFRSGPSNFALALSKDLANALEPLEQTLPLAHLNRGDGDGPMHL